MTGNTLCATDEIQAFVRANERLHVVGRGSKTALHGLTRDAAIADLSALCGIIEYQPSEFTITVRAGTPVADIAAALAEQGQYLPFDPLLPTVPRSAGRSLATSQARAATAMAACVISSWAHQWLMAWAGLFASAARS